MRRRTNPPDPPPREWCDWCEADVIEGAPWTHDENCPRYQKPPNYCTVCSPRPNEKNHIQPTFCDKHDMDDLRAKRKALHEFHDNY